MDRKGIIAVVLALAGIVIYQIHFSKEMDAYRVAKEAYDAEIKKKAEEAKRAADAANPPAPETASATSPAAQSGQAPAPPTPPKVEEKIEKLTTPLVAYEFTNLGGGIARATLLTHIAEQGKQLKQGTETHVVLNGFGSIPIGAVTERPGEETGLPYSLSVDPQSGVATFERTDSRQLQVSKKFSILRGSGVKEEYLANLDLTFVNKGTNPITVPAYYVQTGSAGPIHRTDAPRYTGFDYFNNSNVFKDLGSFSSGGFLGFGRHDEPLYTAATLDLAWGAVTDQYFSTILAPVNAKGISVWAQKFTVPPEEVDRLLPPLNGTSNHASLPAIQGAIGMPGFTLEAGKSATQNFLIYTGPREYRRLAALDQNQKAIMDFGFVTPVSVLLLNSMNGLHALLHNYAAAIILLTLIIRGMMWPLQNRSTQMMKQMQQLSPKVEELKTKYQDEPEKMSREMMKLYAEYGLSPFSQVTGCLPMLIQLPIFWGLFGMLGKAVELRNSHFLWVHDLSQPDTVAMIPGLNFPLNILPLCMGATMLLQMRFSPKSADPSQQRIQVLMPVIFLAFCYNYASALSLYWTVGNIFTIAQLWVTRNQATPVLHKVATSSKKKAKSPR